MSNSDISADPLDALINSDEKVIQSINEESLASFPNQVKRGRFLGITTPVGIFFDHHPLNLTEHHNFINPLLDTHIEEAREYYEREQHDREHRKDVTFIRGIFQFYADIVSLIPELKKEYFKVYPQLEYLKDIHLWDEFVLFQLISEYQIQTPGTDPTMTPSGIFLTDAHDTNQFISDALKVFLEAINILDCGKLLDFQNNLSDRKDQRELYKKLFSNVLKTIITVTAAIYFPEIALAGGATLATPIATVGGRVAAQATMTNAMEISSNWITTACNELFDSSGDTKIYLDHLHKLEVILGHQTVDNIDNVFKNTSYDEPEKLSQCRNYILDVKETAINMKDRDDIIKGLSHKLDDTTHKLDDTTHKLDDTTHKLDQSLKENQELKHKLDDTNRRQDELDRKLKELMQKLDQKHETYIKINNEDAYKSFVAYAGMSCVVQIRCMSHHDKVSDLCLLAAYNEHFNYHGGIYLEKFS